MIDESERPSSSARAPDRGPECTEHRQAKQAQLCEESSATATT